MGPGAPGIALGGLFYLVLSLAGPGVELARAARGRSTAASRRLVARNFAMAVSMLVALDLAYRAVAVLSGPSGAEPAPAAAEPVADGPATAVIALPVSPLLIGLAVLALVLAGTKVAELVLRHRAGRRQRRRRVTGRPLEATGD